MRGRRIWGWTHARRLLSIIVAVLVACSGAIALAPAPASAAVPDPPPAKARPSVASVKPAKGGVTGGTKITIRGKNLTKVKAVTIGGHRAESVRALSSHKLVAVTPAGLPGRSAVQVRTKTGTSKAGKHSRFTYVEPRPADSADYQPTDDTVVAGDEVQWVSGGSGVEDPQAGSTEPWIVGLGPDADVPALGSTYFLPPGGSIFPSGLAGIVSDAATQADGGTAITVEPAPVSDVMDDVSIDYSGPVGDDVVPGRHHRRDADLGTLTFPKLGPSSFLCTDQNSQSVSFSGELGLHVENVASNFYLQTPGIGVEPALDVWVRADVVLTGKVTATGTISCKLRPEWQNAHRKVIPVGTTGATLSFGPTASFSVSGSGTIEITQRSRRMFGVSVYHNHPEILDVRRNLGTKVTGGSVSVKFKASAGLSVQFGALDRIGLEGKAQLAATAKLTASGPPPKVCADVDLSVVLSIGAFLDLWVARWESPTYDKTWPLATWAACTDQVDDAPESSDPAITSLRLPAATNGNEYEARLTTADNRNGTWSLASGSLPTGLTLDAGSGEITGRPQAAVRDWAFGIRFVDGAGRSTTSTVRMLVKPMPVGGGDLQVSLLWNSPADIDLHVIDAWDEEIYYANSESESGGILDHDSNAACNESLDHPIENIYWPQGTAPSGTYTAYARVWSECDTTDLSWHLVIRIGGHTVVDETGYGDSVGYTVNLGTGAVRVDRTPARLGHAPK